MKTLMGLVIAATLAFVGYGIYYEVNDPGHGTVTHTTHDPGYMYNTCTNSICTTNWQPECWRIEYNDGHHSGDACVPESDFARYRKGDLYPRPRELR